MNINEVPIEKLKGYLGDERFEYFKKKGSLETISKIKSISYVCKLFQKEAYKNVTQISFGDIEDEEGFLRRIDETFYSQQEVPLDENIEYNIKNLTNIVKKQSALYAFLSDIKIYNNILKTYTDTNKTPLRTSYISENKLVSYFCSKFQDIELPNSELSPSNLSPEDEKIFKRLQELTQTILLFYIKKNNNYLVYGSYALHLYNDNITYNDIDLYTSDPTQIANIIAFIAYWVYDVTINVHLNPLILHYISVEFKSSHVFDILYLNRENQVFYKEIKDGVSILKMYIQFFNFFRSLTDFHRMKVFQDNPQNTELKLFTILNDLRLKYNIKISNTNISETLYSQMRVMKLYTLDNLNYLMIPAKILPFKTPYSYIFIFITDYVKLVEALPNDSIFFKRHSGIYNEIVAEIPQNANINKRIILKSFVTLNNDKIIPMGEEVKSVDLGIDFFDEIRKSKVLVLSNVYSKLFVDRNTSTIEPISFLNIFASIGLALFLNKRLSDKEERLFMLRMFEYMNGFTIDDTVEKLRNNELFITQKRRTKEQHRSFQPAQKMSFPFSLFFEKTQSHQNTYSKSEYLQYFR